MRPCPTPSDAFLGGQHVRVSLTIDTTLVLPSDAASVICMDGSFDVILSTMVAAVSEGAVVEGQMPCWDSQHVRVKMAPASIRQLLPWR